VTPTCCDVLRRMSLHSVKHVSSRLVLKIETCKCVYIFLHMFDFCSCGRQEKSSVRAL